MFFQFNYFNFIDGYIKKFTGKKRNFFTLPSDGKFKHNYQIKGKYKVFKRPPPTKLTKKKKKLKKDGRCRCPWSGRPDCGDGPDLARPRLGGWISLRWQTRVLICGLTTGAVNGIKHLVHEQLKHSSTDEEQLTVQKSSCRAFSSNRNNVSEAPSSRVTTVQAAANI